MEAQRGTFKPRVITRILLENFMSHARTEILPAAGLTVLTGPNNCGKSAVVEALRVICANPRGDYMVRHGAKSASVILETDEGHIVEWHRTKKAAHYTLNGETVHPRNNGLPDDLHRLLRMPEVESEDGKSSFDIHFADQKSPIFLLNQPGSQAATFFASSSDASYLVAMQSMHRNRVREAKVRQRDLLREIEEVDQEIQALAPLDDLGTRLQAVEALHGDLNRETATLERFEQTLRDVANRSREQSLLSDQALALASLDSPPFLLETKPLEQTVHAILERFDEVERGEEMASALMPLSMPPFQEDTAPLLRLIEHLQLASTVIHRLEAEHDALAPLTEAPALHDLAPIIQALDQVGQANEAVSRCQRQYEQADMDLMASANAIREWAKQNPICPLCHAPIDPEGLLQHAATHQ